MDLYPGWSARDNYGYGAKKKKRKKERIPIQDSGGGILILLKWATLVIFNFFF